MNDCPNAEMRDLLPDLVHCRLDAEVRSMVELHVQACADCQAELALLRDLRATFGRTPQVDLGAVAAAVPAYRAAARRSWMGWRTAAAITIAVAGGSSLLVLRNGTSTVPDSVAIARAPAASSDAAIAPVPVDSSSLAVATQPVPAPSALSGQRTLATTDGGELAMAGGALGELSDRELADLLKDIESLDALPSVDVEQAVVSPISPRRAP